MKKNLLQESELKKMMKMAGVPQRLAENFVREKYHMAEEAPEDDMAPPMDMDEPEGGEDAGGLDVEGLVMAIADAITQQTGVDVEVEGGAGEMDDMGPEEPEMGMEPEDDFEEPLAEGESSHELSAGKPNQAAQGKPKPGSFEKPGGTHIAQLEENADELEEELDEYYTSQRRRKGGSRGTKHSSPSAGGAKVVREEDLEERKQRGRDPEDDNRPDRVAEGDELEEAETMGGSDPNKFPKHLQKEHTRAIAKEVAREVVASLLEQLAKKKD